jgi:3-deoxy-7-phosphoheptulonate synthase
VRKVIIVMKLEANEEQLTAVCQRLEKMGYQHHLIRGVERLVIGAVGQGKLNGKESLETMPAVEKILPVRHPFKLVSREFKPEDTVVWVGRNQESEGIPVGGEEIVVVAGPCAVENREQILSAAQLIKSTGGQILRGGAFKPRTSPYTFQGLAEKGLQLLAEAGQKVGLPVVSEVINPEDVEVVAQYTDLLQIGARNMQNFALLRRVGRINKPVLLKRGLASTIEEWLMAAEYIVAEGNPQVILCERGIRTFETYTRNTLDLSAIPVVKQLSHLPVIVDPSHATGKWRLVQPMALAAIASGADGLMVEVHPDPAKALSDGPQSLNPTKFVRLIESLTPLTGVVGRKMRLRQWQPA